MFFIFAHFEEAVINYIHEYVGAVGSQIGAEVIPQAGYVNKTFRCLL